MDCADVRRALSARLDGEASGVDDTVVDAHLAGCPDCQRWFDEAVAINRQLSVGLAPSADLEVPDLSAVILSTMEDSPRRRINGWQVAIAVARILVVLIGIFLLVWAVQLLSGTTTADQLFVGTDADPSGGNSPAGAAADPITARLLIDGAATRIALAFGLFWVAWSPKSASGTLPILGAYSAFSIGFSTRDLVLGYLTIGSIAAQALLVTAVISVAVLWAGHYFSRPDLTAALRGLAARPVDGFQA